MASAACSDQLQQGGSCLHIRPVSPGRAATSTCSSTSTRVLPEARNTRQQVCCCEMLGASSAQHKRRCRHFQDSCCQHSICMLACCMLMALFC